MENQGSGIDIHLLKQYSSYFLKQRNSSKYVVVHKIENYEAIREQYPFKDLSKRSCPI